MSRRNRQKRAAKYKDRRRTTSQRDRWSTDPEYDRVAILVDHLTAALYNSALCPDHDAEFHAAALLDEFPCWEHDLDLAAEGTLAGAISRASQAGWSPNNLHEFARRRLDTFAAGYLAEAIIRESRHYPVATLHPRWRRACRITRSASVNASPRPLRRWPARWTAARCFRYWQRAARQPMTSPTASVWRNCRETALTPLGNRPPPECSSMMQTRADSLPSADDEQSPRFLVVPHIALRARMTFL